MTIVAPKSVDGVSTLADRKGKGPAICTIRHMGRNEWQVIARRFLEP